jgi:hypothetical protein
MLIRTANGFKLRLSSVVIRSPVALHRREQQSSNLEKPEPIVDAEFANSPLLAHFDDISVFSFPVQMMEHSMFLLNLGISSVSAHLLA